MNNEGNVTVCSADDDEITNIEELEHWIRNIYREIGVANDG